ncbi:MAG: hypothetical protein SWH68_02895 [Thermodesulfobacteriota bacterium]|nr:hypothetical protein [Thermodesulfobacteriota bacterium]
MGQDQVLVSERINEITKMCDREQPVYEQISNFSIALYVLDFFACADLLSVEDVDHVAAGAILKEHFIEIKKEEIPSDYNIYTSDDRYLMVIGDPVFPTHFAVVADIRGEQPFFSKLPFFGSGFDSMAELKKEFTGIDGLSEKDIYFFKRKQEGGLKQKSAKIYTLNNDGNYSVWEYQYATK